MNANRFNRLIECTGDESSLDSSNTSFDSDSWSSLSDVVSFGEEIDTEPLDGTVRRLVDLPWIHIHDGSDNDTSDNTDSDDESEWDSDEESESDSSSESDEDMDSISSLIGLYISYTQMYRVLNQQMQPVIPRFSRVQYTRIDWDAHWHQYRNDPAFETLIRMKRASFLKLVEYLRCDLSVDEDMANLRGGCVRPEMCVYMTLRYLAGGTGGDMKTLISISMATFYYCLRKTLIAIGTCPALAIKFPTTEDECKELAYGFRKCSDNDSVKNVVGALDGYLLSINTPCPADCDDNQKSYYSGHYRRMGMNIQAICDSNKMFLYFALTGPGNMNDRTAMHESIEGQGTLHSVVERLPHGYVVIADAAYEATEHVVPLFYGNLRQDPDHDNFNYVVSQCRIRIEMAFGYMTNKWRILHRPIHQRLRNVGMLVIAIARLHNFCLKESLQNSEWGDDQNYDHVVNNPNNIPYYTAVPDNFGGLHECENPLPPANDLNLYNEYRTSRIRDAMVTTAVAAGARRPVSSRNRRQVLNPLVHRPER